MFHLLSWKKGLQLQWPGPGTKTIKNSFPLLSIHLTFSLFHLDNQFIPQKNKPSNAFPVLWSCMYTIFTVYALYNAYTCVPRGNETMPCHGILFTLNQLTKYTKQSITISTKPKYTHMYILTCFQPIQSTQNSFPPMIFHTLYFVHIFVIFFIFQPFLFTTSHKTMET